MVLYPNDSASNFDITDFRSSKDRIRFKLLTKYVEAMQPTIASIVSNNSKSMHSLNNDANYNRIRNQIDTIQPIIFGSPINVLLLTDRLWGCANGLKDYLLNSYDITVDIVSSYDSATQVILTKPIDFLVVVGYLENKNNYRTVEFFQRLNVYSSVIMYAMYDLHTIKECSKYDIYHMCERLDSTDMLVGLMRSLYEYETQQMHKAASPKATREQIRMDVLKDMVNRTNTEKKKEQLQTPDEQSQNRCMDGIVTLLRRFGILSVY